MRAELKIAVITRTSARPSHPDGSGSVAFLEAARKIHQLGSELIALRVAPLACLAVDREMVLERTRIVIGRLDAQVALRADQPIRRHVGCSLAHRELGDAMVGKLQKR